jgi:hypothetical protein
MKRKSRYGKFRTIFGKIHVGAEFVCNGNTYVKQTTRTARCKSRDAVFYFGPQDLCYCDNIDDITTVATNK